MSKSRYLVLFRNQPGQSGQQSGPSPEQMQQMMAAYKDWMERFKDQIHDMGDKLVSGGRVVTSSGVADGPFVEAKEVVGGYMILSTEDLDAAAVVVQAMPGVGMPGASFEIRQLSGAKM